MVNSDYDSYEEQDESPLKPKAVKKLPAPASAPKASAGPAKAGAKKQTGL